MAIPGYRIVRKIRQGGMSTVYLAIQKSVGREVALKVMSPSLASDPSFGSRFYREAKIVGQLSHPNIVSIYDVGSHKHYNYIAMDFLPGAPLQDKLEHSISATEAINIIRDIASALTYAHQCGYIHRDIKPDNILFRADGSAVLCDFGIAKALKGTVKMTNIGAVLGTPHYMSPEQAQGKSIDGRADIYSLGVVLFEMLTGQVPFTGDDAVAVAVKHMTAAIPKLPRHCKAFQPLIDRMMAKKAGARYQTGAEVIAALDQHGLSLSQQPASTRTQTGSASVQLVNLVSALWVTLWSAINVSFNRLMLTKIQFSSPTTPISHKQQEDLDRFIFDNEDADLPEELGDMPLIQDTIEQPALRYSWRRFYWPLLLVGAVALGAVLFNHHRPDLVSPLEAAPLANQPGSEPLLPGDHPAVTEAPDLDTLLIDVAPIAVPEAEPAPAEPVIVRHALTIHTLPDHARVRILNIKPRYKPGMTLPDGNYHIAVDAPDYLPQTRWVKLAGRDLQRTITLEATRRLLAAGSLTRDPMQAGGHGPQMVVLPQAVLQLADSQLALTQALAISQHEITFAEYDYFATQTGRNLPEDFGWGRGDRPVVGISYRDATAYAQWLSEQTRQRYRLPTRQEWEFAARGGQISRYWWGDSPADKLANCKRGCKSKYSRLFGSSTAPAGSFKANPYGVYDTAGNVAEWLDACQQWQDADSNRCQQTLVAGGSHQDPAQKIQPDATEVISTDTQSKEVGLRVLLEL